VCSSPAVAFGKIFVGSNDGNVYCLNTYDGSLLWVFETGGQVWSSPAVTSDGKLYVGSLDHNIYCVDVENGLAYWNFSTGGQVWSSPSVVGTNVYIGVDHDGVYCFGHNDPPFEPNEPNPPNHGRNIYVYNVELSWSGGDPDLDDTVTYDVYFGNSNPPPKIVANQSNTNFYVGTLEPLTKYFWKIVAWDNHGLSTEGPVWDFKTALKPVLYEFIRLA
jgi:outer membrane protein assembly factor BamB